MLATTSLEITLSPGFIKVGHSASFGFVWADSARDCAGRSVGITIPIKAIGERYLNQIENINRANFDSFDVSQPFSSASNWLAMKDALRQVVGMGLNQMQSVALWTSSDFAFDSPKGVYFSPFPSLLMFLVLWLLCLPITLNIGNFLGIIR